MDNLVLEIDCKCSMLFKGLVTLHYITFVSATIAVEPIRLQVIRVITKITTRQRSYVSFKEVMIE